MNESVEVRWIGDFAVIFTYCEFPRESAIEFTRQQLIDWHGFDPMEHGFTPEVSEEMAP